MHTNGTLKQPQYQNSCSCIQIFAYFTVKTIIADGISNWRNEKKKNKDKIIRTIIYHVSSLETTQNVIKWNKKKIHTFFKWQNQKHHIRLTRHSDNNNKCSMFMKWNEECVEYREGQFNYILCVLCVVCSRRYFLYFLILNVLMFCFCVEWQSCRHQF